MTQEQIDALKKDATERFNNLTSSKNTFSQKIQEILQEQLRIQGEIRLLDKLSTTTAPTEVATS